MLSHAVDSSFVRSYWSHLRCGDVVLIPDLSTPKRGRVLG